MKNNKIKILVIYHKKYNFLPKNKIYIPILAGKSIAEENFKNNTISKNEYNWLKKKLTGDNTGDNISELNNQINEMTAIYWAWKNYDKINNPDYIGIYHYRRFLDIDEKSLDTILSKYYYVQAEPLQISPGRTLYEQWLAENAEWANNQFLENVFSECKKYNSMLGEDFERFFKEQTHVSWCNMFILPKEEFFKYCEFIFPLIFYLIDNLPKRTDRAIGMIAERLTAYYLYQLSLKQSAYSAKRIKIPKLTFWQKIFSITNSGNYKQITILGIKIKIKKR